MVLKHTSNDVAETATFMDTAAEKQLLQIFRDWAAASANAATRSSEYNATSIEDYTEIEGFYVGLLREVIVNLDDVPGEHTQFGFKLVKRREW